MTHPHVYVAQGLVILGTPIDREEFERETGARSARGSEDHLFLEDAAIHGAQGVIEVKYLVLARSAVAAVGRRPAAVP